MNDKLRHCPFCGEDTRILLVNCEYRKSLWRIRCNNCKAEVTVPDMVAGQVKDNKKRLIELWNTRKGESDGNYTV